MFGIITLPFLLHEAMLRHHLDGIRKFASSALFDKIFICDFTCITFHHKTRAVTMSLTRANRERAHERDFRR